MTIKPVSYKGAAFASSLANGAARLTVTLLKLSDNRLDRRSHILIRQHGRSGSMAIISSYFQARPQGGKSRPSCGGHETSSFLTIGLPTLTPKALLNTHV